MILMFTNPYGERFYFQNLGMQWPHDPSKRMIERTTRDREQATQFADEESANAIIVAAGSPRGWEVVA